MFNCNKWHEIEVTAWNLSEPTIEVDGLVNRDKGLDFTIDILILKAGSMAFTTGQGKFVEDGINFQISQKELDDTLFEIINDRTHIEYNGGIYRVMHVIDYSMYPHTQLMECKAMKIINVD